MWFIVGVQRQDLKPLVFIQTTLHFNFIFITYRNKHEPCFVFDHNNTFSVKEEESKEVSSWYIPPTESVRLLFLVVKSIRQ